MRGLLSRHERATLDAAARVLVPRGSPGGGADELAIGPRAADDIDAWPLRPRLKFRLVLLAVRLLPLALGHRRTFTALDDAGREAVLVAGNRHRWALVRLVISYLKQHVLSVYLQEPSVEAAVGYRYECARPREGIDTKGQVHH